MIRQSREARGWFVDDLVGVEDWLQRVRDGSRYEGNVRERWVALAEGALESQRRVRTQSDRYGRIDLFVDASELATRKKELRAEGELPQEDQPLLLAVVEFKDSDWDRMSEAAVRRNVRRHARQVRRYVDGLFEELGESRFTDEELSGICPMIEYSRRPSRPGVLEAIEQVLGEYLVSVAWNDESKDEAALRLKKRSRRG